MKRINISINSGSALISYDEVKAIIYIKNYSDGLIDEALKIVNVASKYIISESKLDAYSYICSIGLYKRDNELSKSYKEIKLIKLELSNRDDFLKIYNTSYYLSLDNIDMLDYIKEGNTYYINYKHQNIGLVIYESNYIKKIIVNKSYQKKGLGRMALSKLLYKINDDTYTYINQTNSRAISLFESLGFKYCADKYYIYGVENEKSN